jgi:signal transduction histidine kinase
MTSLHTALMLALKTDSGIWNLISARAIWLWLAVFFSIAATAATNTPPEFQTAQAIRSLSPADAAQQHSVKLTGIITFFNGPQHYHFIQDDTAGIYFKFMDDSLAPDYPSGQRVTIEGRTDKGEYAPVVIADTVTVLGAASFPSALPVTSDQLNSGQEDSQFVEIRGIVRSVQMDQYTNQLVKIFSGGDNLTAVFRDLTAAQMDRLPDSIVRVHGVCAPRFNRFNQLFENWFLAPRTEDLIIETPAPENPFDVPTQRIGSLLGFSLNGPFGHRVKVEGTVTYRPNKSKLYLQSESSGLLVETAQAGLLVPGDRVEAIGFLAFGDYTPVMQDAIFRKTGAVAAPAPDHITVETALLGTNDCRLVQIEATVLDRAIHGAEPFLVLQSGGFIFHAQMDSEAKGQSFSELQNETKVAVTGICRVEKGENWKAGDEWRAKSFRIELRSPSDVQVLQLPPWWTLQKLLWITGILALVVLAISAWVAALRRRVELLQHDEASQRERIRIAQDIHDEIGSKLAKISYLSDAVTHEFKGQDLFAGKISAIAHTSRDLLSSLDRTVWAVNPSNDSLEQLVNYLGQYAREYFQDTPILCQLHLPRSLPTFAVFAEARHNVLLAFEEALSNVVKHSNATEVNVRVTLSQAALEVTVEDNGRGFDPGAIAARTTVNPAATAQPRHGLTGLQRRLQDVAGKCEFNSAPGHGTVVRFNIPLAGIFNQPP